MTFETSLPALSSLAGVNLLNVGACAGAAIVATAFYFKQQKALPYPPGPKGLPVIGNVLDMPRIKPWVTFVDWSRELGESCS